ncbi:hypothetical protein GQ600_19932 [Phytophthora cactorum]|nr:hypothetical protein GQ600_19932 [Phytophthora cactorum]
MVVTDDQGNKYELGNPAKDAAKCPYVVGHAHSHLAIAPGFTDASRLWFFAVSVFAFYGMCRINEVLSLWKNLTLGLARPSTSNPEVSITYGAYKLEGRKTEVAEGRCYNMHHLDDIESPMDVLSQLTTWLTYVQTKTDHNWDDNDYVFPALFKISKSIIKTDDSSTGCENARVEWGKKMSEQTFITLFNCVLRYLNRNGVSMRGYIRQQWRDFWFTSHTFRRAAGWAQNESAETFVRYLLDQAATDEGTQLADCLAPDRESHVGCPTTFSRRKRNTTAPARQPSSSIEKRLKTVENSVKPLEDKIDMLVSIIQPTGQRSQSSTHENATSAEQISILPSAMDWKDMYQMYWNADAARHLFKPVSEWTSLERKKSGVLPSRLSVAKLIADDVRDFAIQKGALSPRNAADSTLSTYAMYYTEH